MIDLNTYSYSIRNSYISISLKAGQLLFREVGNSDEDLNTLFSIDFAENGIEDYNAEIGSLTLFGTDKRLEIVFASQDELLFASNFDLKIKFNPSKYEFASKINDQTLTVNLYSTKCKVLFKAEQPIEIIQAWNVISSDILELIIPSGKFTATVSNNNFTNFQADFSQDLAVYKQAVEDDFLAFWQMDNLSSSDRLFEAKYVLWSGFVYAKNNFKYDACYMSMNIMTNIWSWDNCFVSLGLAKEQPQRAYEQFMSFAHVQAPEGNYPDFMNPNYVSYDFTKPPVQGVLYLELINQNKEFFTEYHRAVEVIATCKQLVSYWLDYRTFNQLHNLPFNTHGNDTGLDNATIFEQSVTVRSPDLMSYLIELIKLINLLEETCGLPLTDYSDEKNKLITELTTKMYREDKFISYDIFTDDVNPESNSIIELLPLLSADVLPREQRDRLVASYREFMTERGIPSEKVTSSYYMSDGYWRGPIWAPTTMLCILGLKRAGELELANEVATKYIKMCEQHGFAENFDAISGVGLCDKGFAWTAAVYKYLKENNE